jgi:hypothetical protein
MAIEISKDYLFIIYSMGLSQFALGKYISILSIYTNCRLSSCPTAEKCDINYVQLWPRSLAFDSWIYYIVMRLVCFFADLYMAPFNKIFKLRLKSIVLNREVEYAVLGWITQRNRHQPKVLIHSRQY